MRVTAKRNKQRVNVPEKIRVNQRKKLTKTSRQRVKIKKWVSKNKKVCRVKKQGSKWRIEGLRKGRCTVKAIVPKKAKYRRTVVKAKVKVVR